MKLPVSVRQATATDALRISDIHVLSRAATYRDQLPHHYLDVEMVAESAAFWPGRMARLLAGDGVVFIAEHGGLSIGFICLERPDADRSSKVDNLHILPDNKGGGAGSALLDCARKWAVSNGTMRLHLAVLNSNKSAIGFYESRDWLIAGRQDEIMGGVPVVMLRYELTL
jgi:ribosomal protein S18 acetylase RimI-like enzyme